MYQQVDAAAARRAIAHCAKHYPVPEDVAFVELDMWPQQPGNLIRWTMALGGGLQELVYYGGKFDTVDQLKHSIVTSKNERRYRYSWLALFVLGEFC